MRVRGFAPILGGEPRVLILGSAPGVASLKAGQYYGHPRNAFWWIMEQLYWPGQLLSYPQRCERLIDQGIAVWDVLASCERPGSLDSAIVAGTEVCNDIAGLLSEAPSIRAVLLNGGKAQQSFRRYLQPQLAAPLPALIQLPSTSPANARLRPADKLQQWTEVLKNTACGQTDH